MGTRNPEISLGLADFHRTIDFVGSVVCHCRSLDRIDSY